MYEYVRMQINLRIGMARIVTHITNGVVWINSTHYVAFKKQKFGDLDVVEYVRLPKFTNKTAHDLMFRDRKEVKEVVLYQASEALKHF
jgi:hypothetical protein